MKKMNFIRFGGLSPVKQDHYETGVDKGFHNPPRKRGIYAFPYPYVEPFLLGATDEPNHISNKTQWLRDENGDKISRKDFYDHDHWDMKKEMPPIFPKYKKLLKKLGIKETNIRSSYDEKIEKSYITVLKKPREFEYSGELWHHLGGYLKPEHIIEISGGWVKTDMENYLLALRLDIRETKRNMLRDFSKYTDMSILMKKDPYKHMYTKDHLEVFIERL